MQLSYEIVTTPSRLRELESDWEGLLERSATNDPTLSPFWHSAWWEVFGDQDGRRLRAVAIRNGERLVGMAPLLWRRHWYKPGIPVRRIELLSSGEPREHEICTEYNGILVQRGAERAVASTLVEALQSNEMGGWDELVLPLMDGDAPFVDAMAKSLATARHPVMVETQTVSPYIPLPRTWDAYLAALPSTSRYLVSRTLRDLTKWADGDLKFERVEQPSDLGKGLDTLARLHGERWSGDEASPPSEYQGVFASPMFLAFHHRLAPALLAKNALELWTLTARGTPLAALYNYVWGGKVYHYQSGRRVGVPKQIRPGIAIHALAIQRAIAEGRREYDFLGGDSRYKQQLSLAQRPLVQIRAMRRPIMDLARRVARRGLDGARAVQRVFSARLSPAQVSDAT